MADRLPGRATPPTRRPARCSASTLETISVRSKDPKLARFGALIYWSASTLVLYFAQLGMCPDINSLPPSLSTSPRQPRIIPTSSDSLPAQHSSLSSISPASTATMSTSSNHGHGNHAIDIPRRSSRSGIPGPERRRSANLNTSNGNDTTGESVPSSLSHHALRTSSPSSLGGSPIIATGDPHHQRAPSLGELHQELEQEQEAQVVCFPCHRTIPPVP